MIVIEFLMLLMIVMRSVMMMKMTACCTNVLIDVDNPESDVHTLQGARLGFYSQLGFYGARPQYKYEVSAR